MGEYNPQRIPISIIPYSLLTLSKKKSGLCPRLDLSFALTASNSCPEIRLNLGLPPSNLPGPTSYASQALHARRTIHSKASPSLGWKDSKLAAALASYVQELLGEINFMNKGKKQKTSNRSVARFGCSLIVLFCCCAVLLAFPSFFLEWEGWG